jgi:hypothetical protein
MWKLTYDPRNRSIALFLAVALISTGFYGCGGGGGGSGDGSIPADILRLARLLAAPQSAEKARSAVTEAFERCGIPLVANLEAVPLEQFVLTTAHVDPLADSLLEDQQAPPEELLSLEELLSPLVQSGTTYFEERLVQMEDMRAFLQRRVDESYADPRKPSSAFGLLVGPGAGAVPSGGTPPQLGEQTLLTSVQAVLILAELANSGLFETKAVQSPSHEPATITITLGDVAIEEVTVAGDAFVSAAVALAIFHAHGAAVRVGSIVPAQEGIWQGEETNATATFYFRRPWRANGRMVEWSSSRGSFNPEWSTTDEQGQAHSSYTGTQAGEDDTLFAQVYRRLRVPPYNLVASRRKKARGTICVGPSPINVTFSGSGYSRTVPVTQGTFSLTEPLNGSTSTPGDSYSGQGTLSGRLTWVNDPQDSDHWWDLSGSVNVNITVSGNTQTGNWGSYTWDINASATGSVKKDFSGGGSAQLSVNVTGTLVPPNGPGIIETANFWNGKTVPWTMAP